MSRTRLPGHIPRVITALLTSVAVVFGLTACMNDTSKVPDDYITFFGGEPQNPLIPTNTQEINGG
jgi:oligopeptide transport system substrate-binding protein